MAKRQQILDYRILIPDGKGGYRDFKELSPEEREAFREKNARRMAQAFANAWGCRIVEE